MNRHIEVTQPRHPAFLTYHQIQRKIQDSQSRNDLFEHLLRQDSTHADAESCAKIQQTHEEAMEEEVTEKHHGCRCSKIGCLKLYCECFANGRKCNGNCECSCCKNKPGNQVQILQAKMLANYRHPGHFKGIPALTPTRRCTCKKSMCQKRYCQCYSAGLKCTQFCQCKDCQNGHPHTHDQSDFYQNFNQHDHAMEIQVQG